MLDRLRTTATARRTRLWVTIAARRVDPSELLESTARDLAIPVGESIAFDGSSAALELKLGSIAPRLSPRARLRLDQDDRDCLAAAIRSLAAVHTVQDIIVESHVRGHEGVDGISVLSLDALLERIQADELRAAIRYITDRDELAD